MMDYASFLQAKAQLEGDHGFAPVWVPDFLFDFQAAMVEWACRMGRRGMGAELKATYYRQAVRNVESAAAGVVIGAENCDLLFEASEDAEQCAS